MGRRRVAITGLGVVSPLGAEPQQFFTRLLRGESGIGLLSSDDDRGVISRPASQCLDFDPEAALGKALTHTMDRFSQLGAAAAFSAWQDAGFALDNNAERVDFGVAWGTGVGGVLTYEQGYRNLYKNNQRMVSPLSVVLGMNNAAAAHIAIKLGLGGPNNTYSVACASSTIAIGEAFHQIRDGQASLMLVGGSEAPLAFGVVRAWEALRVLSSGNAENAASACRPFNKDRTGLVLGEGAGALVIEDWEHAAARGARIYAELVGYGTSCDHSHLVRPSGAGEIRAMQNALDDGRLDIDQIDYVNAHGTATQEGDPTEISSLKTIFGHRAPSLPVSATKSMHGHMLGATGAIEAIITVLAINKNAIPPTAQLNEIDPNCVGVNHVRGAALTGVRLRAALSNSFAFGGANAVLAFRAV